MMKKSKPRMALCITLVILNLAFIWGNSMLPGEISAAFSNWVRELLGLGGSSGGNSHMGFLVRKLAHFSEFASLGFLLSWLTAMVGFYGVPAFAIPLLSGFVSACADETIQIFAVSRGPSIRDVGIDTAGVFVGVVVLILGHKLIQKIHKPMEELS